MNRVQYIELLDKKYPLCFSSSAGEDIEREFGNVKKFAEVLGDEDGKPFTALNRALEILMDAGRRYCNVAGLECPEPLPCRPADVLMLSDPETMKATIAVIFATLTGGSERTVEAQIKNPEATPDK